MDTSSSPKDIPIIMLTKRHLEQLKAKFPCAVIFFYVEANMSWITADRFSDAAKQVSIDIRVESRDRKGLGRPGVETTDVEKRLYTDAIAESLSSEALVYAKDFISDETVRTQSKFEEQLNLFRRIVKAPAEDSVAFTKPKISFSGLGADDTIMAVGIMLLNSRLTRQSPEYLREAEEQRFDT